MRFPMDCRCGAILLGVAIAWLAATERGAAQQNYDDATTPEGWAWALIKQGKEANFDARCATPALDPRKDDERWNDNCRRLSATFVSDVLTREPWRSQLPSPGLQIAGARVEGDIDLANARLVGVLSITRSQIERDLDLKRARTDNLVRLDWSRIAGTLWADEFHSKSSLWLRSSQFKQSVMLSYANIVIYVDMDGAIVEGELNAASLQVGVDLFMDQAAFQRVILLAAKISGQVSMKGATFGDTLDAESIHVGQNLFMQSSFKKVDLKNAEVGGQISMVGVTVSGNLDAEGLNVKGPLMLSTAKSPSEFKSIKLRAAKIGDQLALEGAKVEGEIQAEGLEVATNFFMRRMTSTGSIDLTDARVNGSLGMGGAVVAALDLSGSSMRELFLESVTWRNADGSPGALTLRNTHVVNLNDATNAWPQRGYLHLGGFTFDHSPSLRSREIDWWDTWARLDREYTPAFYEQLAAAFNATGDRSAANDIRYSSRIRQLENEKRWGPWLSSNLFRYTAGFGIGDYTFWILYWVIGISAAGSLYLRLRVPTGREHGLVWCYGASLSRLLPIIEINKEFTDFFNDPDRKHLTGFQTFVFSVIALVGWLLGAILIAAVSGLVPKG